ncbi:MAG: hypothetical protein IKA51_03995 [Clostridia bacterium]|nr:hypothetical protein [Clostridia bacterium]
MIETKIITISPREEQTINEYACFGWQLVSKTTASVITTGTGNSSTSSANAVTLTFQRDTNMKNYEVLNSLFSRYCNEEDRIANAVFFAKIPKKIFVIFGLIGMIISSIVLFSTLYVEWTEFLSSSDTFMYILFGLLMFIIAALVTLVVIVLPIAIVNDSREGKARVKIAPEAYANMSQIANEARKYL